MEIDSLSKIQAHFNYRKRIVKTSKAQKLLQGKRIVGVDHDCSNSLILMLEDGTTVEIEAANLYVGDGMTLTRVEVRQKDR